MEISGERKKKKNTTIAVAAPATKSPQSCPTL